MYSFLKQAIKLLLRILRPAVEVVLGVMIPIMVIYYAIDKSLAVETLAEVILFFFVFVDEPITVILEALFIGLVAVLSLSNKNTLIGLPTPSALDAVNLALADEARKIALATSSLALVFSSL